MKKIIISTMTLLGLLVILAGNVVAEAKIIDRVFAGVDDDARVHRKTVVDFFNKNFPEFMKELEQFNEVKDPEKLERVTDFVRGQFYEYWEMRQANRESDDEDPDSNNADRRKWFEQWLKMKKQDLKSYVIGQQISRLRVSGKNPEQLKKLEEELKTLLSKLFDERLKQHQNELKELEREIARMKRVIAAREKNRERIIQRRYEELTTTDDEELEW